MSKMIDLLQVGSTEAAKSMDSSKKQVENAVNQANTTAEGLCTIKEFILRIDNMNMQTATASEKQGVVSAEINRNILQINELTLETAQGAEQVSQASHDSSCLASELSRLVQQFKV